MYETGTRPPVWLRNKPMDLSACVNEELGHEEGGGVYTTLLSDTLNPNGHTGTVTRPGVWLINKPTDLSACVSEERGHGEGESVYTTFLSCPPSPPSWSLKRVKKKVRDKNVTFLL